MLASSVCAEKHAGRIISVVFTSLDDPLRATEKETERERRESQKMCVLQESRTREIEGNSSRVTINETKRPLHKITFKRSGFSIVYQVSQ